MSKELIPPKEELIYLTTYELGVTKETKLLHRVAHKAKELGICGYIARSYSGLKAGGELEANKKALMEMMAWLTMEVEGAISCKDKIRFTECQVRQKSKYKDFFCC